MDDSLAVNDKSIAHGQLQIIFKSELYSFTGKYILQDDDTTMLSKIGLQFDYLISVNGDNFAIHQKDLKKIETLVSRESLQRYVKFEVRLITSEGLIKILTAEGKIFDINKKTAAEWRKTEQNLRNAHDLLQTVFDASPHAISVYRILYNRKGEPDDFEILSLNASTVLTIGMRPDEVVGKRFGQLFPYMKKIGVYDHYMAVAASGERADFETTFDDHGMDRRFRFIVVRSGNLLIVTTEDVTTRLQTADKLRQCEMLLQQTEEAAETGSWIYEPDNGRFHWSDGMYRLFDIPNGTPVQPGIYMDYALPDDRDMAGQLVHAIDTDPRPLTITLRIVVKEKIKTLKIKSDVLAPGDGQPACVIGVDADVTTLIERQQKELGMRELNKQLRNVDKAKTKFFSDVSHEFRTPLTLLLASLDDLLKVRHTASGATQDLQKLHLIRRNALRLQKLANTLLDFSRVEARRMEAIFQPTDLGLLTADIASNFRSTIENAGLRYIVKTAHLDQPIYVNHDMWEKIVLNLISNAFKFTHHGKIEVVLKSRKKHVELRVRDTGIGIATDNIARIFERFARVEGAKARTHEGSGIGLALVKELVLMHSGTIKVKSTEGKGAEFIVTVPKGKDHLPSRQVHEYATRPGASISTEAFLEESKSWLAPHRADSPTIDRRDIILVVDDNADMRQYLNNILEEDYHVVTAENGRKALDQVTEDLQPALILTDVRMPEMDGHALVQALRSNITTASIPVIFLSAWSGENARIESLRAGASYHLTKPFSVQELTALIATYIRADKQRQEHEYQLNRTNIEVEQILQERTMDLARARHNMVLLNEALNKKNQELRSLNDELSNFTFIASHDLREPLRKIELFNSQIVHNEAAQISRKGLELAGKIHVSAQRLNDLINDILTFSQTASKPRSTPTRVNLDALVQQVLGDLADFITENHAQVQTKPLTELWGNPVQLSQLLLHLITNAIKFQPKDQSPVIRISGHIVTGKQIDFRLASPNIPYFCLEISDNGIGFDPQYTDRIFQMFQRLHAKEAYPGTGMGLAICKKIVENHNGFILAKGTPGVGSTFYCYFPM